MVRGGLVQTNHGGSQGRQGYHCTKVTTFLHALVVFLFALWIVLNVLLQTWDIHSQRLSFDLSETTALAVRHTRNHPPNDEGIQAFEKNDPHEESMTYGLKQYTCQAGSSTFQFPRVPDLIIAGAQKSGTTALFALLEKHPSILRSKSFETHFFDMHYGLAREKLEAQFPQESVESIHCRLARMYEDRLDFLHARTTSEVVGQAVIGRRVESDHQLTAVNQTHNQPKSLLKDETSAYITMEKTPMYMIWPHIPQAILDTCPWKPKIVLMLRNPIDRLYSHYSMRLKTNGKSTDPLDITIDKEIEMLRKFGLSQSPFLAKYSNLSNISSLFSFDIPSNLTEAEEDRLDSINFRGFGNHRQNQRFIRRGMYAPLLRRWLNTFKLDEELLILRYEDFRARPQQEYARVLQFLGVDGSNFSLPKEAFSITYKSHVEDRGLDTKPVPLNPRTREFLQALYRPYNEQLSMMLGNDTKWLWVD